MRKLLTLFVAVPEILTLVNISDLGDVPQDLRVVLEKALSGNASQASLDRYLPAIRQIIANMLNQLKQKQIALKSIRSRSIQDVSSTNHGHNPHLMTNPPPTPPEPPSKSRQVYKSQSFVQRSPGKDQYSKYNPSTRVKTVSAYVQSVNTSIPAGKPSRSPVPNVPSGSQKAHVPTPYGAVPSISITDSTIVSNSTFSLEKNPMAALQQGPLLERRASKRYSAYQLAKHLSGGSTTDLDLSSVSSNRQSILSTKFPQSAARADFTSSTTILTDGDISDTKPNLHIPPGTQQLNSAAESSTGEKLSIYLQFGRRIKKCRLESSNLTISAIRLLFVNKFSYTHEEPFPEIYIQDIQSGVKYELDEDALARDVQSGTLLCLNVKDVDDVKTHLQESLATLSKHLIEINSKVVSNSQGIEIISQMQKGFQESCKKSFVEPKVSQNAKLPDIPPVGVETLLLLADTKKLSDIKRDVTDLEQVTTSSLTDLRSSLVDLVNKAKQLQSASELPPPGDSSRSFMEQSFKKLSTESDELLTNFDDLQDIIEALRKDVSQRFVRPDTRQLRFVSKELETTRQTLEKMDKYVTDNKASWKKIWERELDKICEEQQNLNLHEGLVEDLIDDIQKAEETLELVKQCSTEHEKQSGPQNLRRVMLSPPAESLLQAKNEVLSQVSALNPNHKERVDAIERAAKLRKKDLQIRGITSAAFLEELGSLIEESQSRLPGAKKEDDKQADKKKEEDGKDNLPASKNEDTEPLKQKTKEVAT